MDTSLPVHAPEPTIEPMHLHNSPPDGLFARVGRAILKRVRGAAWGVLDLGTEFEPID